MKKQNDTKTLDVLTLGKAIHIYKDSRITHTDTARELFKYTAIKILVVKGKRMFAVKFFKYWLGVERNEIKAKQNGVKTA